MNNNVSRSISYNLWIRGCFGRARRRKANSQYARNASSSSGFGQLPRAYLAGTYFILCLALMALTLGVIADLSFRCQPSVSQPPPYPSIYPLSKVAFTTSLEILLSLDHVLGNTDRHTRHHFISLFHWDTNKIKIVCFETDYLFKK